MTPDFLVWCRTRLATPRVALLGIVVIAALFAAGESTRAVAASPIALLLVATFRLWDDVADRSHDRRHHPDRVVARTASIAPFVASIVVGLVAAIVLVASVAGPHRGLALATFAVGMVAAYRTIPSDARRLRTGLVLLKYPAFVLVLASVPSDARALLAAIALYAVLLLHDLRDEVRT